MDGKKESLPPFYRRRFKKNKNQSYIGRIAKAAEADIHETATGLSASVKFLHKTET